MSRIIQLEVPDTLFMTIERHAAAQKSDPATVAISALQQHFQAGAGPEPDAASEVAFRALFGAEDRAPVTGLDNDSIDADLANEYARGLTK